MSVGRSSRRPAAAPVERPARRSTSRSASAPAAKATVNRGWTAHAPGQPRLPAQAQGEQSRLGYAPARGQAFVDGVSPGDVRQGALGDCYLISTLAAFALKKPEVIRDAIRPNRDGTFTVRLHRRTSPTTFEPVDLRVDATFPAYAHRPLPAFAKGTVPRELWGPILEKAFAQLTGGYSRLDRGGLPTEVMEALTGRPATLRLSLFRSAESNFERLRDALAAGKPATAATWMAPFGSLSIKGLVEGHAYTVMRAYEERGQKYVVVRNPWGHGEAGRDGRDDGVFRLTLADFNRNYPVMFIAD